MLKNLFIFLFLGIISLNSWALGPVEAKILYKSSSERSVAIDLGDLDDFKEGSFGKIFIQRGDYDKPTLFLVGLGKIVKSFPTKSIWLIGKSYIKNRMRVNEKVLILLDSHVTIGRETKFRQKQIIFNAEDYDTAEDFIDQNKNNVPDKFIENQNKYEASDNIFEENAVSEIDKEFTTYDSFKKSGSNIQSDDYNDQIKGLTYFVNDKFKIGDLKKAEDLRLLDGDAHAFMDKAKSQRFGLSAGLYKSQKKIPGSREFNEKITVMSTYDMIHEKKKNAEIVNPQAIAKINRDGEMWSADMDEATLRRYFITSGMMHEKMRREISANELDGHEILFSYAGNTSTHSTSAEIDPAYQFRGYNLSFGYDLHLSRTSPELKNWSIQLAVDSGLNFYSLGAANGRSEELIYGAYLNYYFYNNPLTLNQFIWQLGLGVKFGLASMSSEIISKPYDYQVLNLPSLQLMTKYRMHVGDLNEDTLNVGVSLNAGLIYEHKSLRIVNSPTDNIKVKIEADDLKYQFGLSVYF